MSQVIDTLRPGRNGRHPLLLVRCAGCEREYRTTSSRAEVEPQRHCRACRPLTMPTLSVGDVATRVAPIPSPHGKPPRWRVTCPDCGSIRHVAVWAVQIRRTRGRCSSCANRENARRRYA